MCLAQKLYFFSVELPIFSMRIGLNSSRLANVSIPLIPPGFGCERVVVNLVCYTYREIVNGVTKIVTTVCIYIITTFFYLPFYGVAWFMSLSH